MQSDDARQLDIFGSAIPLSELPPHSPCTCDEECEADADEHLPQCPVELELREAFRGF